MSRLDEYNFIKPEADIQPGDRDWTTAANLKKAALKQRWQTERGKALKAKLVASGLDRQTLEQEVGRFNGHFDLRGIDLSGEDFSGADLRAIDFYAANLADCNFKAADLRDTYLSECDIRGAKFDWARMDGVFLDNVDFDVRTSFAGVDLNRVNFTLAALLQELAISQQRIQHLEQRHPWLAFILKWSSYYGQSIARFMTLAAIIVAAFAGLFWWLFKRSFPEAVKTSLLAFLGVTVPDGAISWWATLETLFGYFMLALLAAILVRKTIGSI